jgi:hypothetical protein
MEINEVEDAYQQEKDKIEQIAEQEEKQEAEQRHHICRCGAEKGRVLRLFQPYLKWRSLELGRTR